MRKFHDSLGLAGVLLVSVVAWAQESGEISPKHDLNGHSCTACHVAQFVTPSAPRQEDIRAKGLPWDSNLLTRTFQTYDAPAPSGSPTAAVLDETQLRMSSLLCASCHDGVSTTSMNGTAGFRSRSSTRTGRSLENEHPIDVPHDPAKDPNLAALDFVSKRVKLFGDTKKVQCATCHNVHDSNDPKLLRLPNQDSSLCLTCHL